VSKHGDRCRGKGKINFGFVVFKEDVDAEVAKEKLNGTWQNGRKITVADVIKKK
jgi:RNA recognition motif-containing protein